MYVEKYNKKLGLGVSNSCKNNYNDDIFELLSSLIVINRLYLEHFFGGVISEADECVLSDGDGVRLATKELVRFLFLVGVLEVATILLRAEHCCRSFFRAERRSRSFFRAIFSSRSLLVKRCLIASDDEITLGFFAWVFRFACIAFGVFKACRVS